MRSAHLNNISPLFIQNDSVADLGFVLLVNLRRLRQSNRHVLLHFYRTLSSVHQTAPVLFPLARCIFCSFELITCFLLPCFCPGSCVLLWPALLSSPLARYPPSCPIQNSIAVVPMTPRIKLVLVLSRLQTPFLFLLEPSLPCLAVSWPIIFLTTSAWSIPTATPTLPSSTASFPSLLPSMP